MNEERIRIANRRKRQRQQQVKRQLICIAVILVVVCLLVSCAVRSCSKKKAEKTKEVAKQTEEQVQETEAEKLARVKKEAEDGNYPENVIELLTKNPETVDFVDHYAEKKDEPCAETIEEFESGVMPHLLQWDERWGYASYGTSIIAASGCGPTCMAMVVSYLTDDAGVTPDKVGEYAQENGHLTENNSTLWTFMSNACTNWGVKCTECGVAEEEVERLLNLDRPIICNVGEGDFTENGHYIVFDGYNDGKVSVKDPFSIANTKEWVYEDIKDQIKGAWSYSLEND